jgi:hypothetical protein
MTDAILIVGAGPAGLMAAVELSRLGLPVRIIDKRHAPAATSRAIGIKARTLELMEQRGLTEEMVRLGDHAHFGSVYGGASASSGSISAVSRAATQPPPGCSPRLLQSSNSRSRSAACPKAEGARADPRAQGIRPFWQRFSARVGGPVPRSGDRSLARRERPQDARHRRLRNRGRRAARRAERDRGGATRSRSHWTPAAACPSGPRGPRSPRSRKLAAPDAS